MSNNSSSLGQKLVEGIEKHAGTAIGVGILLIIMGVLAIGAPFITGISVMFMVGFMMIVSGIGLCVLAFRVGAFGAGVAWFIVGALTIVAGLLITSRPISALASMTLLLACYFVVSGIAEFFTAFGARSAKGWGWMAFSGVMSLVLGVLIWRQFPVSGIWAIGTLFGLKLLFSGTSILSLGMAVRRGAKGIGAALKA